ncbi:hypothetical protein SAMN02745126_05880 [Enhydrobacter aerosaccus]|uniref:Uncharacterized protein n=1 Tax=Enhydrobacter aerosaccus TaxID=225324 RepID=A0A1T4T925_9HYPH|nr:hypothetical protein [Enhydrobacter aerosaccus]SKA37080.1 hypothetical protein SAMN02745126_05880 [Enhydrobacter aerosaccus]
MSPPAHRLTDAEGALLDEIAILSRQSASVPIKDLELRLEDRGFTEIQMRRALMSLLRRGQLALAGGKFVACKPNGNAAGQEHSPSG